MIKVSIIVPNYNHALYLKERLDSIFNQTFQDFEVILLDDASTDDSVQILSEYAKGKRVSHFIINTKNSGSPFKQWKKGIELARGEYVWIAESDDSCDLNFLEEQLKMLQKADISVAKILVLENDIKTNKELHNHFYHTFKTSSLLPEHFIDYCPIGNVSAIVFKRGLVDFSKTHFSSFEIIGDMMFYFDYFINKKIYYNDKTQSYFRKEEESLSNLSKKNKYYFRRYFKEHSSLLIKISNGISIKYKKELKNSLSRRFNKIRNRMSFNQKLSIVYLSIYFSYLINRRKL